MFEDVTKRMNKFFNDGKTLQETDPEFIEIFNNFAYAEVIDTSSANCEYIDDRRRCIIILSCLIGAQGISAFEMMLPVASKNGVSEIALREIVYQATAYVGLAGSLPFLRKINDYMNAENIERPLEPQATTSHDTRLEDGEQVQMRIFGEQMKGFATSGPKETQHIRTWLVDNCFGDYYTRNGLDLRERELVTFSILAGLGGCQAQMVAHAQGNVHVGNDRNILICAASQCTPYLGYPRVLNALQAIDTATLSKDQQ